jgi:MFS family permease
MTTGSVLAVPAVVGIATANSLAWFVAAWIAAGWRCRRCQPAFGALTRWWGPRRVTALTAVTLIAGLASTVFAPLTASVVAHLDWRHTYLALAVVLAVVRIPLHGFGLRGRWPHPVAEHDHPDMVAHTPDSVLRCRAFIMLVVAMSLAAFAVYPC